MSQQPVQQLPYSADVCPGFPDHCPSVIPVPADPPAHYGGIRCGCVAPSAAHIDETLAAGEPDNPAARTLAQHIADHPISTVQAAFRELGMRLTFELHEKRPVPERRSTPLDEP